jgi:hypothetical protein
MRSYETTHQYFKIPKGAVSFFFNQNSAAASMSTPPPLRRLRPDSDDYAMLYSLALQDGDLAAAQGHLEQLLKEKRDTRRADQRRSRSFGFTSLTVRRSLFDNE